MVAMKLFRLAVLLLGIFLSLALPNLLAISSLSDFDFGHIVTSLYAAAILAIPYLVFWTQSKDWSKTQSIISGLLVSFLGAPLYFAIFTDSSSTAGIAFIFIVPFLIGMVFAGSFLGRILTRKP
jgi:peptidoglycan/LPS O-acetylase OafA/YrhL